MFIEAEGVDMLRNFPIKINNVAIPFPDSWSENPIKTSSEFETEDGHRIKTVKRVTRLSISASFTVSSRWLEKFETWRRDPSLTVMVYDPFNHNYNAHTMDIADDSFSYSLIKGSERASNTNGLYKLSFDLEEF